MDTSFIRGARFRKQHLHILDITTAALEALDNQYYKKRPASAHRTLGMRKKHIGLNGANEQLELE